MRTFGGGREVAAPQRIMHVIKRVCVFDRQVRRPLRFVIEKFDINLSHVLAFAHKFDAISQHPGRLKRLRARSTLALITQSST